MRAEAVLFAQTAVVFYEWEGYSDGPLSEAEFAAEYLQQNPHTLISGYIDLFLLHRYRAAFEAAEFEHNPDAGRLAAERYAGVWKRVRQVRDVVIRAVADNIDTSSYVYIKTAHHPRASQSP